MPENVSPTRPSIQRQVQQAGEERPAQREHDADVQQALAVVFEDADELGEDDDAEERGAGEVEAGEALGGGEVCVEQHVIDHEAHEQRLDHLQPGHDQRDDEEEADGVAVGAKPAEVVEEVFASFAAAVGRRRGAVGVGLAVVLVLGLIFIESAVLVVFDEGEVALARGAFGVGAFGGVAHGVTSWRTKIRPVAASGVGRDQGRGCLTENVRGRGAFRRTVGGHVDESTVIGWSAGVKVDRVDASGGAEAGDVTAVVSAVMSLGWRLGDEGGRMVADGGLAPVRRQGDTLRGHARG
jgi:hypothetical protein